MIDFINTSRLEKLDIGKNICDTMNGKFFAEKFKNLLKLNLHFSKVQLELSQLVFFTKIQELKIILDYNVVLRNVPLCH